VLVVLRIIGVAAAIAIAAAVAAWLFTGDRRWLRLAWQIFKYAVFVLVLVLLLFAGEALLHGL
jgi:cell division protein FtsW (lipid II flippase)